MGTPNFVRLVCSRCRPDVVCVATVKSSAVMIEMRSSRREEAQISENDRPLLTSDEGS